MSSKTHNIPESAQPSQPVDTKQHQTNAPIPNKNNKKVGDALEKSLKADRHRKEEEVNHERRHGHQKKAGDDDAPLFERVKALGGAVIDGTSELTEGCKKEYHSHKSKQ